MATGQNLDEVIKKQENNFKKKNEKIEKRKVRFKKRNIVFGSIFLTLLIIVFAFDLIGKNNSYEELKDTDLTDTEKIAEIASSSE